MPEYKFDDIIANGLRISAQRTRASTQKVDGWNAKPLLRFFTDYWITFDPMSNRRKVLVPERVFHYIQWRQAEGAGVATIRREIAVGSKCIRNCKRYLYWDLPNPFENPPLEQPKPRKRRGTREEIAALLLSAQAPLKDMVLFYLNTWMRPSEARELKWHEIQGDRIILDRQKNGTDMPLALSGEALAILDRQPRVSAFVFTREGQPLTKDGLQWLMRLARRKAATAAPTIGTLQLRDLRRTGATHALAQPGVHIKDVQAQLRQKTLRTTEQVYTEPSIDRARSAVTAAPWVENVAEGF